MVVGENNSTRIVNNLDISFNKLAGVAVEFYGHASIVKNEIFKNINQGILVCEYCSAHVESNLIYENIKANVAFGGDGSQNNVLIGNEIFQGRCEGIFLIEGGFSYIFRNKIHHNHDGIVCCTALPDIQRNEIYSNRRNGIIVNIYFF